MQTLTLSIENRLVSNGQANFYGAQLICQLFMISLSQILHLNLNVMGKKWFYS